MNSPTSRWAGLNMRMLDLPAQPPGREGSDFLDPNKNSRWLRWDANMMSVPGSGFSPARLRPQQHPFIGSTVINVQRFRACGREGCSYTAVRERAGLGFYLLHAPQTEARIENVGDGHLVELSQNWRVIGLMLLLCSNNKLCVILQLLPNPATARASETLPVQASL